MLEFGWLKTWTSTSKLIQLYRKDTRSTEMSERSRNFSKEKILSNWFMQPLPADCKTVTLLMIDQQNLSTHLKVISSVFVVLCITSWMCAYSGHIYLINKPPTWTKVNNDFAWTSESNLISSWFNQGLFLVQPKSTNPLFMLMLARWP